MQPSLTPDEREWIKYTLWGAAITAFVTAAADVAKDEIKEALKRRRERKGGAS